MEKKSFSEKIELPGLRNIKTALSILTCLIVYQLLGRENEFIAITSAVICLQDSVDKSLEEGMNRVIGTMLGGIYGILFLFVGFSTSGTLIKDLGVTLSCIAIIYICNLYNKQDYIINAIFVFILVVLIPAGEQSPFVYAYNRIIDTLIGIIIAVTINRYFFPPRARDVSYKRSKGTIAQLKKDCVFIKECDYKKSEWEGGNIQELLIYPKNSLYEDFDFKYRISIAETVGDIDLPIIPDYYRITMVLDGETNFVHDGAHSIHLKKFDQDYFRGNLKTYSEGTTVNFNIIFKKGHEVSIELIRKGEYDDLLEITSDKKCIFERALYYSLYDRNVLTITKDGFVVFVHILNKGDSILFKRLNTYNLDDLVVNISNQTIKEKTEVLCIKTNILNRQ